MIRYIREKGGFFSVTLERVDGIPNTVFRHHGVTGDVYHVDIHQVL